jgi:hypothetical protein
MQMLTKISYLPFFLAAYILDKSSSQIFLTNLPHLDYLAEISAAGKPAFKIVERIFS